MSPASAGNPHYHHHLDVEKYIGACLITQNRPIKTKYYHQRWGVPLISYQQPQQQHHPQNSGALSRLVVHTQGAPLILSKSYNHAKKKTNNNNNNEDIASGTNSLPRIIKPRKRRKKERKPNVDYKTDNDSLGSTSPASTPEEMSPDFLPFIFMEETPKLHHSFEEIQEGGDGESSSSCQCRYCDPCGQIWDVDRRCYSPYLTFDYADKMATLNGSLKALTLNRSANEKEIMPAATTTTTTTTGGDRRGRGHLEVSTEIVTSPNGHRDIEIKFFSLNNGNS